MIRPDNDRRWKVFYISPNQILNIFYIKDETYDYLNRLKITNLPEDFVIDQLHFDKYQQSFRFLIYHESFDLVEKYQLPPIVDVICEVFENKNVKKLTISNTC